MFLTKLGGCFCFIFLLCALAFAPGTFAAESRGSLLSRMDRIEQRLAELSAGIHSSAPSTPVAGGNSAAHLEVSLSQIREEMRRLRGQMEQLSFEQRQLKASLARIEQDTELRLGALERQSAANIAPINAQPPMTQIETGAARAISPAQPATAAAPQIHSANADAEYKSAFDALNNGNHAQAESEFSQFIQRHSDHSLIGNAYYWLGETYYVQGRHEEAADQFRQGFQTLPEGPKAPENLLRLGMTLNVLERKKEACIILKQLLSKYEGRSASTLRKAQRENEKIGCS